MARRHEARREFATKKSVDTIGALSSLVWAHVVGTLILFALLFLKLSIAHIPVAFPIGTNEWLGLLLFGTLQAIVYSFAYKGFEKGEVSILSPIFASYAGGVAVLSVFVLREVINIRLVPALVCIFGGVKLMNLDWHGLRLRGIRIKTVLGLKEIIIATLLATLWTLGWDKFTGNKNWMVYTTFMFVFMTLSAFAIARHAKANLLDVESGMWKFVWLIAIGEVMAYLAITLGYASTTHASIVAVLSGASSLPTIVLARIFLREQMTRMQTISSLLIIAGIVLLSIS